MHKHITIIISLFSFAATLALTGCEDPSDMPALDVEIDEIEEEIYKEGGGAGHDEGVPVAPDVGDLGMSVDSLQEAGGKNCCFYCSGGHGFHILPDPSHCIQQASNYCLYWYGVSMYGANQCQ